MAEKRVCGGKSGDICSGFWFKCTGGATARTGWFSIEVVADGVWRLCIVVESVAEAAEARRAGKVS